MDFKRTASAICALALVCGMAAAPAADAGFKKASPVVVASAETLTYGDFEYEVTDGAVTITKYIGAGGDVVIPPTIDGKSVTRLGYAAFYGCTSIISLTISSSIESLGSDLIYGCINLTSINVDSNNNNYSAVDGILYNKDTTKLLLCPGAKTSVTIPSGVTSIESWAFYGCTNLESIIIPNSVTKICEAAFYECTRLKSVIIPNGVTAINESVFCDCSSLENVTIPSSVESICPFAFSGCTSLKSITIPDSVKTIYYDAFYQSDNISDIYYTGTTKQWKLIEIEKFSNDVLYTAIIHCTDGDIVPSSDDSSTPDSQPDSQSDSSSSTDVTPAPAKKSLSKAKVKAANKTYTGKALTPKVTVTLDGKTLSKGTDYTAAYKNNKNCGKATVTVTGKGSYTGSKSGSFVIKPGKVTAKKATSPKKQQVKVTWTKAKGGVTGYQVQVALDKKFKKSAKTYTVKKAATTSKTVKKLKSKKTYYVRVRAYKTVGLKKYTGKWSAVKSVKCK